MHDYDKGLRRLTIDCEAASVKMDELRAMVWATSHAIMAMTEAYLGQPPVTDCGDYALRVVPSV